jgi:hypothetical protein
MYNPLEFALEDIMVNSGLGCICGQNGVLPDLFDYNCL